MTSSHCKDKSVFFFLRWKFFENSLEISIRFDWHQNWTLHLWDHRSLVSCPIFIGAIFNNHPVIQSYCLNAYWHKKMLRMTFCKTCAVSRCYSLIWFFTKLVISFNHKILFLFLTIDLFCLMIDFIWRTFYALYSTSCWVRVYFIIHKQSESIQIVILQKQYLACTGHFLMTTKDKMRCRYFPWA